MIRYGSVSVPRINHCFTYVELSCATLAKTRNTGSMTRSLFIFIDVNKSFSHQRLRNYQRIPIAPDTNREVLAKAAAGQ